MKKFLVIILFLLVVGACQSQPDLKPISVKTVRALTLLPGETAQVTCETSLSIANLSRSSFDVTCAAVQPAPTVTAPPALTPTPTVAVTPVLILTPTATATPPITATPLPTPAAFVHPCGVDATHWHPAVIDICQTHHEHGDAPPAWITSAGYDTSFTGMFATGPKEDGLFEQRGKHTSMKGFLTTVGCQTVYLRAHFTSTPFERSGEVHSYELFVKDCTGAVSHFQGWVPAGQNLLGNGRCRRDSQHTAECLAVQGQANILMESALGLTEGIGGEQWYVRPALPQQLMPNIDWFINPAATQPQAYEYMPDADLFDVTKWVIKSNGTQRAIEVFWPSVATTLSGSFYTTQFGVALYLDNTPLSGPDDPMCQPTTITILYGKSYPNFCLMQTWQPTLLPFDTGVQMRNYDAPGVQVPN